MRPAEIADLNRVKNFLILFLSAMLAVGALMSRPGEESFRAQLRRQLQTANVPADATSDKKLDDMTDGWVFKDCYLWSQVEIDGHVAYAGAFSRWFALPESEEKRVADAEKTSATIMARVDHGN